MLHGDGPFPGLCVPDQERSKNLAGKRSLMTRPNTPRCCLVLLALSLCVVYRGPMRTQARTRNELATPMRVPYPYRTIADVLFRARPQDTPVTRCHT